ARSPGPAPRRPAPSEGCSQGCALGSSDPRSAWNQLGGSSGVIPAPGGTLGGPSFKRNLASPVTGVEQVFDVQVLPGTISPHISAPRADRDTGRPRRTVPPP